MDFISRLIKKRITSLVNRFNAPQIDRQYVNDYPIEGMGDHHRFFI